MAEVERRRLLVGAAAAAGALAFGVNSPAYAGAPRRARAAGTVAVLGGGVGGLSAAHELAERGFSVTVYERGALGGKARSIPVAGTATSGRKDLPGEHGFRFFPGIYLNLPDTMGRIPFPGNADGCRGNLVDGSTMRLARAGGRQDLLLPFGAIDNPGVLTPTLLTNAVGGWAETALHLPPQEAAYFAARILVFMTSCDARRWGQWENTTWWEFIRATAMSDDYQKLLAIGLTRNLVATKAETASTWTVAHILEAFVWAAMHRGDYDAPDRVLNGPTNEAWIHPWVNYLRGLGVQFEVGSKVTSMSMADGRIAGVTVTDRNNTTRHITADWYVSAIPVEHCRAIWGPDILAADPALKKALSLSTDWMTGLQYFLTARPDIVNGHCNYVDSPWSLTSINQAQFWKQDFAASYGDGTVVDCLSVDISEWNKKGILFGKTAKECTRQEVEREVWAQIKAHLEDTGQVVLPDRIKKSWHLDPGVGGLGTPSAWNAEQLLIHPVGTLEKRPSAVTRIPNLFLASDYVRNDIDLATMEGANEAARMAVNGILDASGSAEERVMVHQRYRAPEFEPFKAQDEMRYRLGMPNAFDLA